MLLTLLIAWMVLNVALVALVVAHPPRHFTRPSSEGDREADEASGEHRRAA